MEFGSSMCLLVIINFNLLFPDLFSVSNMSISTYSLVDESKTKESCQALAYAMIYYDNNFMETHYSAKR